MFYVYEDWTLEEQPRCFYVGKGTHSRVCQTRRNKFHTNIKQKYGMSRKVVFSTSDEEEAKNTEIRLIAERKTYVLDGGWGANFTRGGEGSSGYKHTRLAREKITAACLGRKHSQDSIEKMKKVAATRYEDPSERIKFCGSNNGRALTVTENDVWLIREAWKFQKPPKFSKQRRQFLLNFATQFKTTTNVVCDIVLGGTWKHVGNIVSKEERDSWGRVFANRKLLEESELIKLCDELEALKYPAKDPRRTTFFLNKASENGVKYNTLRLRIGMMLRKRKISMRNCLDEQMLPVARNFRPAASPGATRDCRR